MGSTSDIAAECYTGYTLAGRSPSTKLNHVSDKEAVPDIDLNIVYSTSLLQFLKGSSLPTESGRAN